MLVKFIFRFEGFSCKTCKLWNWRLLLFSLLHKPFADQKVITKYVQNVGRLIIIAFGST